MLPFYRKGIMIIMWMIILCTIVGIVVAQQSTFTNYKLFRITTPLQEQVESLSQLTEISDGYSFWTEPSVKRSSEIMVAPHKLSEFYEIMTQSQASYELVIPDVQYYVTYSVPTVFDFRIYHTLETIYWDLKKLATQYSGKVQVVSGGKTYEGRSIQGVKVSFKPGNLGIFLEGGIHAREWISPATVMYILHQLLTSTNSDIRNLAESYDWYIFPTVNPDGYVYTHTINRMWKKTVKPNGLLCRGTDLNRNWGYKWSNGGFSSNPCSETYAGSAAFSEIETKSLSEYITSIADKLFGYIAFHSYRQLLMFPYGHTEDHIDRYNRSLAIAEKAVEAIAKGYYHTKYEVGNVAETTNVATGSSTDWVKGIHRIPVTFTYELRDQGQYGFLLPPAQIVATGDEVMLSLVAMFKDAK